jgi:hypothetical protein
MSDSENDFGETVKAVTKVAMAMVVQPILRVLQGDPHYWSERPCGTCRTITSLAGEPFGCELYAIQKKQRRADTQETRR